MNNRFSPQDTLRKPLNSTRLSFGGFSCTDVSIFSACGASGLVYNAYSHDYYGRDDVAPAHLIIKECYPAPLAHVLFRDGDLLKMAPEATEEERLVFEKYSRRYAKAFDNNIALYQGAAREQISVPTRAIEANGTIYIVNNASNGDTLDVAFSEMGFYQQVETLARLCETLSAIHDAGFVHLDIKPENVLCIRSSDSKSNETYYSDIRLFDFDTVTAVSELDSVGAEIPNSGNWSSFEQTHAGREADLGAQSDIYSIGALLFWIIIGRPPAPSEVIHANGNWRIGARDCTMLDSGWLTDDTLSAIEGIFNATLTVKPSDRYPTASDAAAALKRLEELIMPVGKTMSARFDNLTASQEKLEQQMSELLRQLQSENGPSSGGKAVKSDTNVRDLQDAQEPRYVPAEQEEPSESDVIGMATQASVMAARIAELEMGGIPEWLRNKLRKISDSGKKALLARDKDAIASLSEESEILCAAAIAFATIEKYTSIEKCPPTMVEAAHCLPASFESALSSNDFSSAQSMVEGLAMAPPLLTAGIKLSTMLSSLESNLSQAMREQVIAEIDTAAAAIAECDEESTSQALSRMRELEAAVAEDAYMGMMSAYL